MRFHASHQRTVSIKMATIVDAREVISKRLEAHLNFAARKIGNRNFERFVAAKMNYESRRGIHVQGHMGRSRGDLILRQQPHKTM